MKKLFYALACTVALASCGSDYEEHVAQGKYGNKEWKSVAAKASKTVNLTGSEIFEITLSNEKGADDCSLAGNKFSTTCPRTVGEHEFGIFKARFGSFYVDGTNILSNDGAIEILSIDEENNVIKGRVWCENDEKNNLSGTFTATICE